MQYKYIIGTVIWEAMAWFENLAHWGARLKNIEKISTSLVYQNSFQIKAAQKDLVFNFKYVQLVICGHRSATAQHVAVRNTYANCVRNFLEVQLLCVSAEVSIMVHSSKIQ